MTEQGILSRLTALTKDKSSWPLYIPEVATAIEHPSARVKAKALWLLGEMGLLHPERVSPYVEVIAGFLCAGEPLLRERALNALGRIGRGNHILVEPYLPQMRLLACDSEPSVRLAFVWACENIATNAPELFENDMLLFSALLDDENDRVRIEAPEIFRVLGKRKPGYVTPYISKLQELTENDSNSVVRIHAAGAIRATRKGAGDNAADE